jgi:hypothetical protein
LCGPAPYNIGASRYNEEYKNPQHIGVFHVLYKTLRSFKSYWASEESLPICASQVRAAGFAMRRSSSIGSPLISQMP